MFGSQRCWLPTYICFTCSINTYIYIYIILKIHIVSTHLQLELRLAAWRISKKLGLRNAAVSKQSKHLSYSHPSMEAVRKYIQVITSKNEVEPRLVANFDQVWSVHYEPPKSVLHKPEDQFGQLCDKRKSFQKIIEQLEIYMGVSDRASMSSNRKRVCAPVALDGPGAMNPVDYNRNARTLTTLSWRDGDLGRAWITLAPGSMSGS